MKYLRGFCPQYLQFDPSFKKEVSDEVCFLHADKHENFLQISTIILDGDG